MCSGGNQPAPAALRRLQPLLPSALASLQLDSSPMSTRILGDILGTAIDIAGILNAVAKVATCVGCLSWPDWGRAVCWLFKLLGCGHISKQLGVFQRKGCQTCSTWPHATCPPKGSHGLPTPPRERTCRESPRGRGSGAPREVGVVQRRRHRPQWEPPPVTRGAAAPRDLPRRPLVPL
jgi:hypothetical protein